MLELVARAFVLLLTVYAMLGMLFAVLFVWIGVQRLDAQAVGAGIGFRLLILPGVAAFWPMLFARWMRGVTEPPAETNPHRAISVGEVRK
jgi:hypothetical protein